MNETRSSESWRIVRVSPAAPRMTSWCATRPRTAGRARGRRRRRRRGRPRGRCDVASGIGALPASRRAAAMSSAVRRAVPDGRVGLVGVVQLDDLDGLEERGGLRGEAHHQDRADGEVGGDQHAGTRRRRRARPRAGRAGARRSRWCRRRRGCRARCRTRRLSITTSGWVKSTTASAPGRDQLLEVVAGVDRGHQLDVVGRLDRPADLRADLAAGAQHADPDLCPDLCIVSCAHAVNRIGRAYR